MFIKYKIFIRFFFKAVLNNLKRELAFDNLAGKVVHFQNNHTLFSIKRKSYTDYIVIIRNVLLKRLCHRHPNGKSTHAKGGQAKVFGRI
jgi:hypothetical protein